MMDQMSASSQPGLVHELVKRTFKMNNPIHFPRSKVPALRPMRFGAPHSMRMELEPKIRL